MKLRMVVQKVEMVAQKVGPPLAGAFRPAWVKCNFATQMFKSAIQLVYKHGPRSC